MSSCTHAYGFPWNRPRNEIAEPYSVCIFIFIRWCILPIVEVEFVLAVSLPQQHMVLSNFKFLSIWIVFSGISEWILVFIFWFTLYGIGSWKLFSFSTWKMSMTCYWASLVAQLVKNLPAMQETWVPFLGWEDPLKKGTATHSSILA